jgi:CRP/FNR family cyclic AMP-dependent transcriptional regulator
MLPTVLHQDADCLQCHYRPLRSFCNLHLAALTDYSRIGTTILLAKGATPFYEGDAGDRVLVICSGQVKLSCASRSGKTLNLKLAQPGDVLGLGAVMSGGCFEVTGEVIEPTYLKIIGRADFLALLARHGEASFGAAKALANDYKSAFSDARRMALSGSIAGRLAGLLLNWGQAASDGKPDMRFTMVMTHDDLASFTGSSRETVTRTLGKFQKDKLIEIRGASVRVLSPDKLELLAA